MIYKARCGERSADTLVDRHDDVEHTLALADSSSHAVARPHRRRRLGACAVDLYVTTTTERGRRGPGWNDSNCPQPSVDACELHRESVSRLHLL